VESVAKSRLLPLLGRERLYRLQVKIVIEMEVTQIFSVNQEVEHIVALSADLQACLDPVKLSVLKKLCALESFEKTALFLRLWSPVMQAVENPSLKQLLVAHSHLHRIALWTMLFEPLRDQRNIVASPSLSRPLIEGLRRPV
jgi:hypothetical protein